MFEITYLHCDTFHLYNKLYYKDSDEEMFRFDQILI